jgi:hypothetical protein
MTRNLLFKKSLHTALFLGLLTFSITAMENYQHSEEEQISLKAVVDEEYKTNFQSYHLKAINFIVNDYYAADKNGALTILKKMLPQLSEQKNALLYDLENLKSWPIAISNFIDPRVMNVYPIPPVDQWPIRGFVKKYNEELLRQVMEHIEKQKADRLQELLQ